MSTPHPALTFIVPDRIVRFIKAMIEWQRDEFDVPYFLEKPWKWEQEFTAWLSFGCPAGPDDEGWGQFTGTSND